MLLTFKESQNFLFIKSIKEIILPFNIPLTVWFIFLMYSASKCQYISIFPWSQSLEGWNLPDNWWIIKSRYEEEDKVESCWNNAILKVFWTHSEDAAKSTGELGPIWYLSTKTLSLITSSRLILHDQNISLKIWIVFWRQF